MWRFNNVFAFILMLGSVLLDGQTAPGSLYEQNGFLADMASDIRALRKGDLLTIVVSERSTASATAQTTTSRKGSTNGGVNSIFGPVATTRLSQLVDLTGKTDLTGTGSTTRQTTLTTTLAAVVTEILPNGDFEISATRSIKTNSEVQTVTLTGQIRRFDLGPANQVRSDRIANLKVSVNGRGVVNDAVRRPNIVVRLIQGILPF